MPINVLFDFLAPIYDHVFRERLPEELMEVLALPAKGFMLDAGGGTGRVSSQLRKHVDNLVIADLSRPMLRKASDKHDCCFVQTSATSFPFPDNFFSRIMVIDALHHFPDQPGVVKELVRILKPGGRLLIEEPDIHLFPVKLIALAEKLALMGSHMHTYQMIQQMINRTGISSSVKMDGRGSVWVIADKPIS